MHAIKSLWFFMESHLCSLTNWFLNGQNFLMVCEWLLAPCQGLHGRGCYQNIQERKGRQKGKDFFSNVTQNKSSLHCEHCKKNDGCSKDYSWDCIQNLFPWSILERISWKCCDHNISLFIFREKWRGPPLNFETTAYSYY